MAYMNFLVFNDLTEQMSFLFNGKMFLSLSSTHGYQFSAKNVKFSITTITSVALSDTRNQPLVSSHGIIGWGGNHSGKQRGTPLPRSSNAEIRSIESIAQDRKNPAWKLYVENGASTRRSLSLFSLNSVCFAVPMQCSGLSHCFGQAGLESNHITYFYSADVKNWFLLKQP